MKNRTSGGPGCAPDVNSNVAIRTWLPSRGWAIGGRLLVRAQIWVDTGPTTLPGWLEILP
jgi:hypothetical protein